MTVIIICLLVAYLRTQLLYIMGNGSSKKQLRALNKVNVDNVGDSVKNKSTYAKVVDVYDGDTCTIIIILEHTPVKLKLRLAGIDAAEKPRRKDRSDRTKEEQELCAAATEFLSEQVLGECVYVELHRWGKWGGRVIGDLYNIDQSGEIVGDSLSKQLLDTGTVVEYYGKNRDDTDWAQVYQDWVEMQNTDWE